MNDLDALLGRVFRYALFFMAACFLAWALVPGAKPYAAGLVLGTLISLANARILYRKIQTMTRIALENNGKKANPGFFSRACMVLVGTMISLKFPQFHLMTTIAGFFFVQLATLLMGFIFPLQPKLLREKR
ncbi:ATP synthase I chain [compost metagenome]